MAECEPSATACVPKKYYREAAHRWVTEWFPINPLKPIWVTCEAIQEKEIKLPWQNGALEGALILIQALRVGSEYINTGKLT